MSNANKKEDKKKNPGQFIPMGFVLKYDPPVIGLLYKPADQKKQSDKKKMYTIHLNQLIFLAESEDIVEALFQEHPNFLDPNIIKPEQVFKLVLRLVAYRDHQLQNMGAFMTDDMGQEYYQDGEEEEEQEGEYNEEEIMNYHQQQMLQQQMMKQQQMMQLQGAGKKKGKSEREDLNNKSF